MVWMVLDDEYPSSQRTRAWIGRTIWRRFVGRHATFEFAASRFRVEIHDSLHVLVVQNPASSMPDKDPPGSHRLQHRTAWTVNMLINPLTITPPVFLLIALHDGLGERALPIFLVAFAGYFVLPLGLLMALKRSGQIATIEARDRSTRTPVLWMGVGLLAVAGMAVVFASGWRYGAVGAVSMVLVVNAIIAAFINARFKMSLHVGSVAGAFSILATISFISGQLVPGGLALLVIAAMLIPLLMWARTAEKAHSRSEVWFGALFGLLAPSTEILILHTVWPLYA